MCGAQRIGCGAVIGKLSLTIKDNGETTTTTSDPACATPDGLRASSARRKPAGRLSSTIVEKVNLLRAPSHASSTARAVEITDTTIRNKAGIWRSRFNAAQRTPAVRTKARSET